MWATSTFGRGLGELGLGLSASAAEAVGYAARKRAGVPGFAALGYLNVGVTSTSEVPPELPRALADADLGVVAHLEEFNLVEPTIRLDKLALVIERAAVLDVAWLQEDLGLWLRGETPLVGHMMNANQDEESLANIVGNIKTIQGKAQRLFLAENAPVYLAVDEIDLLTFLGRLADAADCGLILDIGHFVGYCIATNRDPAAYLAAWTSIDRVIEMHIAGFDLIETQHGTMWLDDHARPLNPLALRLLAQASRQAGNLKAITLEQEDAPGPIVEQNIAAVVDALGLG